MFKDSVKIISSSIKEYFVDDNGNVYSQSKKTKEIKKLKLDDNGKGYKRVKIAGVKYYVHRLVALHFVPNKNNLYTIVNHLDGNPNNNHYKNLEWIDKKGNTQHAWKTGRMEKVRASAKKRCSELGKRTGKINGKLNSKIKDCEVEKIRKDYLCGSKTQKELSKEYNVTVAAISYVIKNR